ncbi:aspartyl-phosphate phosphatase Spo0E family protein [Desulfosporosinus sp.]|uniref:aspartyl-phosphate phosphatase Spo0E family protein n=1 Tax=Desulfosporosinus sp. TaxID=157907 RepID=UPI0025BE20DE|nr:aspartyl-phosphate phosphatase Spo0E family protein [Desulfosporosinus sp.]MBC2724254.1 aspartyl-phosphate phosphatase Spo0E family protein [Desulfosporosinus sp.]MBC2727589.1 aspartyl-phosphate phosphatase Spo0E family protein [Desulfosporosinus sp.]
MSELDKVVDQIEKLRSSTIKVQEDKSSDDPEAVAACHELHTALDRYQEILMRIQENE